jgi:DNA-binding beta-propeller fold protein YncE
MLDFQISMKLINSSKSRTNKQHQSLKPLFNIASACLLLSTLNSAYANKAVVLNSHDASLTLIDQHTDLTKTIPNIGKEPHHLYPSPDGKQLWIANAQSDSLIKIDPITGTILQRVPGIADPYQLAFSSDGKYFISVSLRLNRVDIYAHQTAALASSTAINKPTHIIINKDSPDKNSLNIKVAKETNVNSINTANISRTSSPVKIDNQNEQFKLLKRIPTGALPSHTAFSLDQTMAYVTLQGDNQLIGIDMSTQAIAWKIPVGKTPAGLWVTPQGMVLVGIMGENYVQVIDPKTRSTVKKIITGNGAHAFRGRGDGKTVFVSNRDNSSISAIDMISLTKVYDIKTDSGPDCMDVSADGKMLWVTNRWRRKVSAIDIASQKTVKQYNVGGSPHGIYLTERAAFK